MNTKRHVKNASSISGVIWNRSSHSGQGGGACVEVGALLETAWRKSSYSGPNGGACVEVAPGEAVVGVRDSKNPDGPALLFGRSAWGRFLGSLS